MSKRKSAASKRAQSRKTAAKAERAVQEIVRSPKDRGRRPAGAQSTESSPKPPQEEALENAAAALQDATGDGAKKATSFSLTATNVRSYQAKLLEIAQANTQFAFEFAQRLATIRSPVELPSIVAEFTSKRMAMFRQHSKELVELSSMRRTG